TLTGTQLHVLELIRALHRSGAAELRVLTKRRLGSRFRGSLSALDGVEMLVAEDVGADVARSLVVHRPYQLFDPADLSLLTRLGGRLVITLQDLIAFGSPQYSRSAEEWLDLRQLTRVAAALADRVVFFSDHVRRDTVAAGLGCSDPSSVVHL